ncbi:MAG: DUF4033 domain-containing protein [Cyanobacteria bacterium P01_E01_bin.34]
MRDNNVTVRESRVIADREDFENNRSENTVSKECSASADDIDSQSSDHSGHQAISVGYDDNTIDLLFIWLFSRKMASAVGQETDLDGYNGFVDLSQKIVQGRSPNEQRKVVAQVLNSLVPSLALKGIRTLFSPTQLVCELNAWFATQMFEWLVGPCQVTEVEVTLPDGTVREQKSGVQIQKCRYLEQSRCVGTCVNLCKLPTQDFFTQEFGIPLTMTPDFEDMSCTMVFGQQAPIPAEDPAFSEPCLVGQCDIASTKSASCPKVGNMAAPETPPVTEVRP